MNDMEMEDNDLNNIARQICETDEDHQKDDNRQVMHLLEVDGSSAISDSENDKLPKQPTISNLSQPLKDPDCISKSSNSTHNVLGNCQLSCRSSFSRWPQSIIENEHSCLEQHKPLTDHLVSDESIQRMCQEEEQEEKCVIPEVDSVNLIITPELNDPSQAALLEKENDVEGTPADYFDVRSSNHDLWSFDVTAEVNTTVVISSTEEQDATDPSHQSVHNIEDGQSNDTSNRQERNDDLAGSNIINDFSENEQKERKEIIIKRSVNLNSTLEQNDEQGQLPDASDIQPSSGKIDDNRDESLRRDNDILGFLNTSIHEEEKENNSMTRQDDPFGQCQHLMSSIKKKKHKSSTIIEEEERQDSDVISQDDSVDQCEHPASRIMKKGRRRRKSIYVRCGKKKYIKSSSFGVEEAGQLDETNAALDLDGSVQKHDVGDVGDHVVEERRSTSTYSCPKETDESQLSWLEEVNDVDGASAVMDNSRVASLASATSPSESAGLSLDANTSALLNNGIDEKEREDSDVISQDNSVDLCEHPASRIMKKGRRRRKSIYVRCGKKKYVKSSSFGVEEAGQLDEKNAALDLDGSVQKHDVGDVGDHVVEERRSTSTYSCPKETDESQLSWLEEVNDVDGASAVMDNSRVASLASTTSPSESAGLSLDANTSALLNNGIDEKEREDSDVISQDNSVDLCEHPASRIMKKGRRRRKSIYVRCGKKKYVKSSSFGVEEAGQLDETNAALDLDGSVQKHDVGDVGDHVVEERRSTSTYSCPKEQPFCNLENKWNKHERNIISPRHRRKKYMELDPHIEGEYVQLDKENAVNDLSGNVKCLSEIINIYSPKGDGRHVSVLKEISNTEVTPEDGHDAGAGPHGRCYKSTVTYRQYSKDSSNQSSAEQNYIEFDVTFSEGDMSSTVDDNLICMNSLLTVESLVLPFPDEPLPLVKKEHSLADEHKEDCVQGIGRKKKKYKRRQSSDSEEINTSAVFKTPKDLKRRRSLRLYYKSLDSCQSEDSYTEKHDNQRCDNNSHEFNSAVDEETLKDGKDAVDNTAASESILSHEHANESQESSQNNTRESEEKSTELQQLEESVTGKTRRQNRSNKQESVNDVYLNKLWKSQMPILKGWETIYEQPNIGRGGNGMLMSKKRLMRSINFEEFYTKKRLNRRHKKAVKLGWKPPTADQNEKALALLAEKLLTLEKDLEETAENNLF